MDPADDDALRGRLLELFLEEAEEQLERMTLGLERLAAAERESSPELVGDLFRSAHSVKGAAQAVGAGHVAGTCHELEDLLAKVRDGLLEADADTVDHLVRLVDTVSGEVAALTAPAGGEPDEEHRAAPPVPDAGAVPVAAGPSLGGSVDERSPTAGLRLRTDGQRLEVLMEEAGALVAASHGADYLLARLTRTEQALAQALTLQGRELRTLFDRLRAEDRESVEGAIRGAERRIESLIGELKEVGTLLAGHHRGLRSSASRFSEAARRARMVPFAEATRGLARMVRELAGDLGKEARLIVTAADAEVDRDLVLMLREVLGHLVRNAVDHGLEAPDERARLGKPRRGTVTVEVSLGSDGVRIVVSDDGAGLDRDELRRAAAAVVGPEVAETSSAAEVMFTPGVSTAARLSSVSGRGVGLDVVRATVEGAGGAVSVESEPGRGTRLSLLLPLNLSTMRALLMRTGGELVALPSASVQRLITMPAVAPRLDGSQLVNVEQELLTVAPLHDILGWSSAEAQRRPGLGLVVAGAAESVVLSVDQVIGEQEVVLRTSPTRLDGVRELLGTTQLDDGNVVLVLNPAACVRAALARRSAELAESTAEVVERRTVLLAEDSLTTRELERSLLESAGYDVLVAHDGQQAWELLQEVEVDAVVSDVNMPRMDGIALCRAVRGAPRMSQLPIVLVSALRSETDRRAGLEAGADAYLTKLGFNRDELIETLDRLL